MAQINPHINFNGNAEEAFAFYQSVFGGAFSKLIRFNSLAGTEFQMPEEEAEKIMHIELPIGNTHLMGNDVPARMGLTNEMENRSKIFLRAESKAEANSIFTGLSAGGQVEVPPDDNSGAAFFAMLRDKYGIEWMVSFDPQ